MTMQVHFKWTVLYRLPPVDSKNHVRHTAAMQKQAVDVLVRKAKIYTIDDGFNICEAMAIHGGRILATGTEASLRERFEPASQVDAGRRCIYPGFIDPHCHLLNYGYMLQRANLFDTASWEEVVERLVAFKRERNPEWLLGRGWDQNTWADTSLPTNELLDRAFPDTPVLVTRVDGHAAVANSLALRLSGLDRDCTMDGGECIRKNGRLTGVLLDNALDKVRKAMPAVSPVAMKDSLLSAQKECFAVGLTSVSDAGTEANAVKAIENAHADGSLLIRVYVMLLPTGENKDRYITKGPHGSDRLTVRSIKLFADGALGSRGALLLDDYADDPGNRGLQLDSTAKLHDTCALALEHGYQVNTHCIGDAAVRLALDVYQKYLVPGNGLRWRIEHAQIVDGSDLPRFRALGVIPSIQTTHATSDRLWVGERLGARVSNAYRARSLLEQHGWLPNGSDFPIEKINPLFGFHSAVTRKDKDGLPEGGFKPVETLTREQAIRAMTIWAARANFEEASRGSLEAGKWADFVILDRDLMTAPEAELRAAKVLATYVGGVSVFSEVTP
jgi:predicted amidohydrolase YtcJ